MAHILDALDVNIRHNDIKLQILPVRSIPLNSKRSHAGTSMKVDAGIQITAFNVAKTIAGR